MSIIALAFLAGAAELVAWKMGFSRPLVFRGSAAGYEMTPGQSVNLLGKKTSVNKLGTRGVEAEPFPAPGTRRILSLGDSVANGGLQVDDAQTYPWLLQDRLTQARGGRVEVLNASAGGWALQNEQKWLAEHGVLGAQLVLLEINEKDLDQAFVPSTILDTNPRMPRHPPAIALADIVHRYVLPRLGLVNAADPGSTTQKFNAGQVASAKAAVIAIHDQVIHSRSRLAILYWDIRHPRALANDAREDLFDWARRNDVPILRPELNKGAQAAALYRDEIHPNEQGNQVIAARLVPFIRPLLD